MLRDVIRTALPRDMVVLFQRQESRADKGNAATNVSSTSSWTIMSANAEGKFSDLLKFVLVDVESSEWCRHDGNKK